MSEDAVKAVRVSIVGRVQGVWYRSWTVEEATALGLAGWVRNRRDGSVEALFSGPAEAVDEMLARCGTGPPAARVMTVEISPSEPFQETGFLQLPTA